MCCGRGEGIEKAAHPFSILPTARFDIHQPSRLSEINIFAGGCGDHSLGTSSRFLRSPGKPVGM
jgi:hypothetical protein